MTQQGIVKRDRHEWSTLLRQKQRRVTQQRLVVLEILQDHPHAAAEEVLSYARAELPKLTVQSVYTVLQDLTDLDLLRKIELPGQPARFETRTLDNHHHAVCVRCGAIEDVDCVVGEAPCLCPSNAGNMTIQVADVLFQGLCPECAQAA
ncbi:Fur family transcriptional regulator [Micrococcoides hystricis]|uniref:Fur family transcriptional regulator n=1 Tax=Micrococcoides hystricis TaxID=1572761 RepID=A0ABV6P964_9MICC